MTPQPDVRPPAVAGKFYPANEQDLLREVRSHIDESQDKIPVIGVVSPHAGFKYSGSVAGAVYSRIEIPETVILLGPNHTRKGAPVSIMNSGHWKTPMGEVAIDEELALAIQDACPDIENRPDAHEQEHALETQLPFLQYFKKDFKIVPFCISRLDPADCSVVAQALLMAIKETGRKVLLVASSDMTHFESHEAATEKDLKAIEQILDMNPLGLYNTVRGNGITMCGVLPATVMLEVAGELGAGQSELVRYSTSGEVNGDMDWVVGYAGMIVR